MSSKDIGIAGDDILEPLQDDGATEVGAAIPVDIVRYILQVPVSATTPALPFKIKECGSDEMVLAPTTAVSTSVNKRLIQARDFRKVALPRDYTSPRPRGTQFLLGMPYQAEQDFFPAPTRVRQMYF
ncbi:hypothetical protein DTO212C5_2701 [Paecilomyces variotii]|nr:hypothetical protein DTO212C5_2701 [Paecilomyces variotii]